MKKTLPIIFILFISSAIAQTINKQWVKDNYKKREVKIVMRDGAKLFTVIYSPNDELEKHPIMFVRTPYTVGAYGEDKIAPKLYETHWKEYLKEGYIFVIQDTRGRMMSEGEFLDMCPFSAEKKDKEVDEASDAFDAIDWLVKNVANNNGNVGVMGISYPGFYATMAALSNHPALKAVSPQAPVTDWYMGDDFHHNGAFMLQDGFSFYSIFGVPHRKLTTEFPPDFNCFTKDAYKFYLETGAIKNFTALLGDSINFWKDLIQHPNYDNYWKARDARRACNNIKPAMLVVGGLFDAEDCYGAWRLYDAIEKQNPQANNKLVMGPWYHGGWSKSDGAYLGNVRFGSKTSEYYQKNIELPFFNYHLKKKASKEEIAEATIFFSGENAWRKFVKWPPAEMQKTPIYLLSNSKLKFEKTQEIGEMLDNDIQAEMPFTQYTSDPNKPVPYTENVQTKRTREYMTDDQRFASQRPDVITFKTAILENDITLAGTITADLKVAISTTDADFIVKIIDVFPDGFSYDTLMKGNGKNYLMDAYQMLVRGEVMRGKFRNSFESPEAFAPNKITTVKFDLPDVAHTFKKGHRLMVQIQSTWFPIVDRNPQQFIDIYHCNDNDFKKCDIKIFHDAENASNIILPILK